MKQKEITEKTVLLDGKGNLVSPGFARKMHFEYNRENIRARPFALKEWDFYQILHGDWVIQLTIGHVSYVGNIASNIFNIRTGEKLSFSRMKLLPGKSMDMPRNPELPNKLSVSGKDYEASYTVTGDLRRLVMRADDKKAGRVDIDITLPNDPGNEKMVIATPFSGKPNQFYLNYKENYWTAKGHAAIGAVRVTFDESTTALIDWGRGVWPFSQEWFWGNGTGFLDGEEFGFNIGWGFGDLSKATENFFFYKKKAYKLGVLKVERDEADYMKPWRFVSDCGNFDLTMTPVFDHYTALKILFLDTSCHQVHGKWSGTATLPDGEKLQIRDLTAFCEHAKNRW